MFFWCHVMWDRSTHSALAAARFLYRTARCDDSDVYWRVDLSEVVGRIHAHIVDKHFYRRIEYGIVQALLAAPAAAVRQV